MRERYNVERLKRPCGKKGVGGKEESGGLLNEIEPRRWACIGGWWARTIVQLRGTAQVTSALMFLTDRFGSDALDEQRKSSEFNASFANQARGEVSRGAAANLWLRISRHTSSWAECGIVLPLRKIAT